jgi:hypothetical protein
MLIELLFRGFRICISKNRAEAGFGTYIVRKSLNRCNQLGYSAVSEEIISMRKVASLSNQNLTVIKEERIAI